MRNPIVRPLTLPRLTARGIVIGSFAALLFGPSPALAQDFAVLGGTVVTCTDSTVVGDVGVDFGGAVIQTSCPVSGTVHVGDTVAQAAYDDFLLAYTALGIVACDTTSASTTLAASYLPGVYCFEAGVTASLPTLTLDGLCTDTWIFKIGVLGTGALTGTNFTVVNPGCSVPPVCTDNNVSWWTAEAATLTTSTFIGSILAGTSITTTGSTLDGQALAKAAVTLTGSSSVCGPAPNTPIPFVGTLNVTGGGQIPVPLPTSKGRATFGFNAKGYANGTANGQFTYVNLVTGLKVSGSVTTVEVSVTNPDGSPQTVRFGGTCSKLPACSFIVTVEDHGEPGTTDEFGITVTGGKTEVRSQRVISRGNIQFHK